MALLIKNGRIITADSDFTGDIYCEGETITRLGRRLEAPPGAEIIDDGKVCLSRPHDRTCNIYLPSMGTYRRIQITRRQRRSWVNDDAHRDAACRAAMTRSEVSELWMPKAVGNPRATFLSHGVTKFDGSSESQLREIVGRNSRSKCSSPKWRLASMT
jgi:dihydropyrimidinase